MDPADLDNVYSTVRKFVRDEVVPLETEIDEKDEVPAAIREAAKAMGLFGFAIPEEYGGLGLSMTEESRLVMELGYTTPSLRSMFGTNNGIAGHVLLEGGTDEQKKDWLPRIASGEVTASFALTEAEAGSDPSGLATTGRPERDGWVLNGAKRFITNAPLADVFMVFARTDPQARATRGITTFLVPRDTPGLTIGPRDHKMGQRGAWTAEVIFTGVRVPADRLIGEEGRGYRSAMTVLARGRLHIAAVCVGTAQRILDESVAHAATSKQGGQLIGSYQLVQAMLADSYAEIEAGRSLVLSTADDYDAGRNVAAGPSAAKLYCSEMVSRVADRGVQVHGGLGYMSSTVVERLYRDSRLYRLYEGTSEIQKLIIARELLAAAQSH